MTRSAVQAATWHWLALELERVESRAYCRENHGLKHRQLWRTGRRRGWMENNVSKYRFKGASAGLAGQSFSLDGELWLGSDEDCQICVQENGVAQRHARIFVDQGQVHLQTQPEAQAELWVNGVAVSQQVLNSGDELRLGSARLVFQAPGLRPVSVLREEPPKTNPWGWIIAGALTATAVAAGVAYWLGYLEPLLK